MQNNNLRRRVVWAVCGILTALLLWQGLNYYHHRGLVGVKVEVWPKDSTLALDNKTIKPGRIYLKPGSHTLKATRADFDDDVKTIDTADITKNQIIYMLPPANSLAAQDWLLEHPDIQKQREAAGGAESARTRAILLKKYPIISKLPQETLHYKIDYSLDSSQRLSFTITTFAIINGPADYPRYVTGTSSYRVEAEKFLKDNGVDITKYKVVYNPSLQ